MGKKGCFPTTLSRLVKIKGKRNVNMGCFPITMS